MCSPQPSTARELFANNQQGALLYPWVINRTATHLLEHCARRNCFSKDQ